MNEQLKLLRIARADSLPTRDSATIMRIEVGKPIQEIARGKRKGDVYRHQAIQLFKALNRYLPQGTYDALLSMMIQHRANQRRKLQ